MEQRHETDSMIPCEDDYSHSYNDDSDDCPLADDQGLIPPDDHSEDDYLEGNKFEEYGEINCALEDDTDTDLSMVEHVEEHLVSAPYNDSMVETDILLPGDDYVTDSNNDITDSNGVIPMTDPRLDSLDDRLDEHSLIRNEINKLNNCINNQTQELHCHQMDAKLLNPISQTLLQSAQNSPHRVFPKAMEIAIHSNCGEVDSPKRQLSEDEVQFLRGIPDGASSSSITPIPPPPVPRIRKKTSTTCDSGPSSSNWTYSTEYFGDGAEAEDEFCRFQQYQSKSNTPDDDYFYYDNLSGYDASSLLRKAVHEKLQGLDPGSPNDTASSCSMSSAASHTTLLKKDDQEGPRARSQSSGAKHQTYGTTENDLSDDEYFDLVRSGRTGKALLAVTLAQVRKSLEDLKSPRILPHPLRPPPEKIHKIKNTYIKNLIVLSVGFMLVFTAFFSLRNLQSSINHDDGLGLMCLSVLYATYLVGCLFAPMIIQNCRPKWAMVVPLIPMVLFTLANCHPRHFTLLPATALLGFGTAVIWTAQGTYITSTAVSYAAATGKSHSCILGIFNGFFLFLIQLAQLFGNLISSSVFSIEISNYEQHSTSLNYSSVSMVSQDITICGSSYCHDYNVDHASFNVHKRMIYILLGVFTSFILLGGMILLLFLDRLDVIFIKQKKNFGQQLLSLVHLHKDPRLVFYVPFLMFLGFEEAFIFEEFTKAYITCSHGLHMIGYVMMVFSGTDAVACFVFGNMRKYLPRLVIVVIGVLCYLGILGFMFIWNPASDVWTLFLIAAGLGIGDAAWQAQSSSITGELFSDNREAAFASLRMYEAVGFVVASAYAQHLCMDLKIYILAGLLVLVLVSYCFLELVHKFRIKDSEEHHPEKV